MRRIAVLSACVLAGGLLFPASALATEADEARDEAAAQHDRWIAVEDHFAIVLPDGQTFTEDSPPPEGEEPASIPVGTGLFISEVLYATADGETRGDEVGRTHIECTAQVVPDNVLCDIVWVFTEGGQLHGSVHVDFAAQDPAEPLSLDIAVTGGTGDWASASGVVSLLDISDLEDPAAETVTLYEAQVQ